MLFACKRSAIPLNFLSFRTGEGIDALNSYMANIHPTKNINFPTMPKSSAYY